jgi:hypothetical protein
MATAVQLDNKPLINIALIRVHLIVGFLFLVVFQICTFPAYVPS